jgi:hypothetical protein
VKFHVVSHKTEYAAIDKARTYNLREAAVKFMENQPLLQGASVFFESTRQEKVARIERLGCDYFIDDLEEVFLESGFPSTTLKILYSPQDAVHSLPDDVCVVRSWEAVHGIVFENGQRVRA